MPTYYRQQGTVQNNQGVALAGVQINVLNQPPTGYATIYADSIGTPQANPGLVSDGNGNWAFYAATGIYDIVYQDPFGRIPTVTFPDQVVLAPGGGSVTSVGFTPDGVIFSGGGSPVTGSGSLAPVLASNSGNKVLASPADGSNGPWVARNLVTADLPAGSGLGTVTSVNATVSASSIFTANFTGGPVTSSGSVTLNLALASQPANTVLAGPTSGGSGPVTARALVAADLPFQSLPTKGFVFISPTGAGSAVIWRAPYACTVTHVRGYVVGGTNAVINATRNGSNLISNLTISTLATWEDGGAITGGTVSVGDSFAAVIVSESGSPNAVTVQIEFSRP
jgi:hypothetical protein